ncbi:hypothetical protein Tco_0475364 [Tanacetum coccineum]
MESMLDKLVPIDVVLSRYIDTRLNGDALRKCILQGPYVPSTVIIPVVPATDDSPEVPERTAVETLLHMSPKKNEHYQSTKEAIHLLLTRIGDKIYSTVDACKTAHDACKTAHDMWIARYQKEVNEICAKRIAKNAKPLALVIAAQQYPDPYYQVKPKRIKDYTYHKEKMMLCKQAEKGVLLQAKQADWLEDTDEEIDEQELEAHDSYVANIQEVDSNVIPDSLNMYDNEIQTDQNAEQCDDERVVLANLTEKIKT